jgi:hypothetical protein
MSPLMTNKKKKTGTMGPITGASSSVMGAPPPTPAQADPPDQEPGQSEPGAEPEKKGSDPGTFGFESGSSASKLDSRIADSMSASAGPRAAQIADRLDAGQALMSPGVSTGITGAPVSRAATPGIDMDSDVTARVIKLLQGV